MNSTFSRQLQEVADLFTQGDTNLGYRRMLDAAMDTADLSIFESTLEFADWYDQPAEPSEIKSKLSALLEKMDRAGAATHVIADTAILDASGVFKRYSSGNFQLSDIHLSLHSGEIIGLVGENGNGKTTLLRLLGGELAADSGQLLYNLRRIKAPYDAYELRSKLAYVPQRHPVWHGSLMENLQFTAAQYGKKGKSNILWTEMIIARLGLRPFRKYQWSRISSGYKMRFELARTLLREPEVMLLDEPLANLDVLAQQIILEDLTYLAQSRSRPMGVILSSQQLYEVEKIANRVLFLKNGSPRMQEHPKATAHIEQSLLIIELETSASRQVLLDSIASLSLKNISYNGGAYLLQFNDARFSDVLTLIGKSELPVKYIRDISQSSRRFFEA